ncbi:unnamed protein product, partial [marine sediment metagenome]
EYSAFAKRNYYIPWRNLMSSRLSDWKIGDTRKSEVHFRKIIEDLRNQFPYDSLTAFVVETFANSLDAEANRIDIFVGKDTIKHHFRLD